MPSDNAASSYSAAAVVDRDLNTIVIALSYTDPVDPLHSLVVCIAPELGSNVYRFKVGHHELITCEVEKLKQRGHTGTFVLWPFPNRVRDGQYTYQGRHYSLASVRKGSLIHGLVYDRAWNYEQPVISPEGASVTTSVEINPASPGYSAYPFASRLALTYTLSSSGLTVTYTVQNKGSQPLPYGFALHPYFSLLPDREKTRVTLPAAQVMEADGDLLPTGRLLDVHSTMYAMFDLSQPTPVHQLKLDHVYTGLPTSSPAGIDYEGLDLSLRISASEDFTHTVVYTPAQSPFFCLENQTCSTDAINLAQRDMQDRAHLLEVQPGESTSGFIRYQVEYK